jgi:hypothetical protein
VRRLIARQFVRIDRLCALLSELEPRLNAG